MHCESSGAEAPLVKSTEFLQTAGRALMGWWNDNYGYLPTLPGPGEAFRVWWKEAFASLDGSWITGPWRNLSAFLSDTWEQLQLYAEQARGYWESVGRRNAKGAVAAPPKLEDARFLPDGGLSDLAWIALAVAAVVVLPRILK
jgi:hypothetical protein